MIYYCLKINQCDCLNGNGPHEVMHFNAWYPVTITVWEGLGGMSLLNRCALLEEVIPLNEF